MTASLNHTMTKQEETQKPSTDNEDADSSDVKVFRYRPDCMLLGVGILFIGVLIGVIFGLGTWRQWDAPSGWYHNTSATSDSRFLPEPHDPDPYPDVRGRSGSEAAGSWYYWKNKPDDVTAWTRLFVWLSYSLHQISIWVVIYLAQAHKTEHGGTRTGINLSKYNWLAFGLNVFFHLLHLLNTQTTYDALAQDVVIVSSQCSVIMLLLLVMILEYSERGLFFGWPVSKHHKGKISRKLTLNLKPVYLARKYHGYAFAWAAIYTFWYHPMENTYGHAMGFFHTWAIMLQGSLMFTKVHTNRWWRLLLECWVTIHGGLVAVQTGEPGNIVKAIWPMFVFGFLMLFCFTQIYILPFWEKIPSWVKIFPPMVYVGVTLGAYSVIPDGQGRYFVRIQEIIRIPGIEYAGFLLTWAFMYLAVYVDGKLYGNNSTEPTTAKRALNMTFGLTIFVLFVAVSIILHTLPSHVSFFVLMVILVFVFSVFSGLSCILFSHTMPRRRIKQVETIVEKDKEDSPTGAHDMTEHALDVDHSQE